MELDLGDLSAILSLFDCNVHKLQANLSAYQQEVNAVRRSLFDNWSHVGRADSRIILVHDGLLSSVSEINENIIKLNLHINLNRALSIFKNSNGVEKTDGDFLHQNDNVITKHFNGNDQQVNGMDLMPKVVEQNTMPKIIEQLVNSIPKTKEIDVQQIEPSPQIDETSALPKNTEKILEEDSSVGQSPVLAVPVLPINGSDRKLLPPKGGRQMSSNAIYDQLVKNISDFTKDSTVIVTMMHLNIAENCIFVGKWGKDTTPIKKLLACQMSLQELHQLPDFGETFAVYDAQDQIIPRVLINGHTEGGGYDAYLLDYGEHIHLTGDEVIFALSSEVKALAAEAIRCYIRNRDISSMREFIYKNISLRILNINKNELVAEFLEDSQSDEGSSNNIDNTKEHPTETHLVKSNQEPTEPNSESKSEINVKKLTDAEMAMLEDCDPGTSNAVKAVLGFIPTDDKRICRHYDPKLGGCFKGSNCRLLHQPFAPHGATKDTELVDPLPETIFESTKSKELGSIVRVLVTNIQSPIQFYVQFVDHLSPLVWSIKDVPVSERTLKRSPRVLDIVLALYSDECYYRAQIIEVIDGMYKIFYVDYGNTEFVGINSLAPCSNAISLKPHQAVNCFIEGIRLSSTVSHSKTVECVEYLKSKLLNCEFDVKLMSRLPDGYLIQFTDRCTDISKQMIKRKYVEPCTVQL